MTPKPISPPSIPPAIAESSGMCSPHRWETLGDGPSAPTRAEDSGIDVTAAVSPARSMAETGDGADGADGADGDLVARREEEAGVDAPIARVMHERSSSRCAMPSKGRVPRGLLRRSEESAPSKANVSGKAVRVSGAVPSRVLG
ncbi:MAG: hypothetical protein H6729_06565 [Deltaproteobacteria bacterium]|nr:hypothetical protein [Deltaproteobacteria bacterium]